MSAAIIARLGLDTKGFQAGFNDARQQMRRAEGDFAKVGASIKNAFAGVLTVGAITQAGRAILDFAGNLADASDALGINVEALQELQSAFSESGAGTEVVNKGLAKLSENLSSARDGNEKMIESFERLGITWAEINQLTPDQILMKIAESADAAIDPAQRLALIIDVMGKSGVKMAAGLNAGAEALRDLRAEASKLSKEEVAAIDAAGDLLTQLSNKAQVLGAKFLLNFWDGVKTAMTGGLQTPAPQPLYHPKHTRGPGGTATDPAGNTTPVPVDPRIEKDKKAQLAADDECEKSENQRQQKLSEKRLADIEKEKKAQLEADAECAESDRQQEEKLSEQRTADRDEQIDQARDARQSKLDERMEDIADPHGAAERKRAKRKAESIGARAEREQQREERGGRSKADVDADGRPLSERVKPIGREKMGQLEAEQRARQEAGAEARKGLAGEKKSNEQGTPADIANKLETANGHLKTIADNYGNGI